MTGATIADLIRRARRTAVAGRSAELRLPAPGDTPGRPAVTYVHGPAGIGKAALVSALDRCLEDEGVRRLQIFSGHEVILRAIGDSKLPKHAADCAYWGGSSCQAGEPSSVESVVAPPPTEQSLLFANAIPATRLRLSVAATALSSEVGTRAEKRVSKSGQAYASFSF